MSSILDTFPSVTTCLYPAHYRTQHRTQDCQCPKQASAASSRACICIGNHRNLALKLVPEKSSKRKFRETRGRVLMVTSITPGLPGKETDGYRTDMGTHVPALCLWMGRVRDRSVTLRRLTAEQGPMSLTQMHRNAVASVRQLSCAQRLFRSVGPVRVETAAPRDDGTQSDDPVQREQLYCCSKCV